MAVIRLELEVDSAVYPELHAALAAIGSSAGRGERFRQLASTGLVWETVRIHGASVAQLPGQPAAAAAAAAVASKPDVLMQPAVQAPPAASRSTSSRSRSTDKRASKSGTRSGDFVDLAISVAASNGAADPRDARLLGSELELPKDIPMLLDVVTPPPSIPRAKTPATAKAAMPPSPKLRQPAVIEPTAPVLADDDAEATASIGNDSALVHKSVVRSRLLRMKEKGLFRNG